MVTIQVISKVLATADYNFIQDNMLTEEYFMGFESEFNFIKDHYEKYGNVPDKSTFISHFPDFEILDVQESDHFLLNSIREQCLYNRMVPVVKEVAKLAAKDANEAAEYMISATQSLRPNYDLGGTDIVGGATGRYDDFITRKERQDEWYFTTGFEELDDVTHGLQRGEELMVLFARTNQGKSWISAKICTHIWELGFNVGYVSPEMSATSIGYRFDTLHRNFSNKDLMWGNDSVDNDNYKNYVDELKDSNNKFIVATPVDFDRRITVSKLRNWVEQYKLDFIVVDGITYMSDERGRSYDNKTTSLTNISEDLMGLSIEMNIPIVVVVQANRGVVDSEPELENIRDSDGIAHNASKVVSITQKQNEVLELCVKKQRFGKVGGKLTYNWNIDKGEFQFIPNFDDAEPSQRTKTKVDGVKKEYNDKEDVF